MLFPRLNTKCPIYNRKRIPEYLKKNITITTLKIILDNNFSKIVMKTKTTMRQSTEASALLTMTLLTEKLTEKAGEKLMGKQMGTGKTGNWRKRGTRERKRAMWIKLLHHRRLLKQI